MPILTAVQLPAIADKALIVNALMDTKKWQLKVGKAEGGTMNNEQQRAINSNKWVMCEPCQRENECWYSLCRKDISEKVPAFYGPPSMENHPPTHGC